MIRILVFSDTHGRTALCRETIKNIPCDLILHAGDINRDARELIEEFPDKRIEFVQGNNDYFDNEPFERICEIGGKRIFLTHGHKYRVNWGYDTLADAAKSRGCDIAVFGHTHSACESEARGVTLLNPGSAGFNGTYGVIEIEDGIIKTAIIGA